MLEKLAFTKITIQWQCAGKTVNNSASQLPDINASLLWTGLPPGAGSRSCESSCRPSRTCPRRGGWRTRPGPAPRPPAAAPAGRWRLFRTPGGWRDWEIANINSPIRSSTSANSNVLPVCLASLDKYWNGRELWGWEHDGVTCWNFGLEIKTFEMDFAAKLNDKFVSCVERERVPLFSFNLYWQHNFKN